MCQFRSRVDRSFKGEEFKNENGPPIRKNGKKHIARRKMARQKRGRSERLALQMTTLNIHTHLKRKTSNA